MAQTRSSPAIRRSRQLKAQLRKHNHQHRNPLRDRAPKVRLRRDRLRKLRDNHRKVSHHKVSKPLFLRQRPSRSRKRHLHSHRQHRQRKTLRLKAPRLRPPRHPRPKAHPGKAARHRHPRPHPKFQHPSRSNRRRSKLRLSSQRPRILPSRGFGLTEPSVSERRRATRRSRSTHGKSQPSCARAQLSALSCSEQTVACRRSCSPALQRKPEQQQRKRYPAPSKPRAARPAALLPQRHPLQGPCRRYPMGRLPAPSCCDQPRCPRASQAVRSPQQQPASNRNRLPKPPHGTCSRPARI